MTTTVTTLLSVLLLAGVGLRGTYAAWGSRRSDNGPYEIVNPSGELDNNSRCAKIENVHGPRGYRQNWRPMNTADPSAFWSVPTGPRNSYTPTPDGASAGLWEFLGGEHQIFVNFVGFDGARKSVFASLRCAVYTNIEVTPDRSEEDSNVGVSVTVQDGATLVVAAPKIRDDLGFEGQPFHPVVLGMTPGDPGAVISSSAPWQKTDFSSAPAFWVDEKFRPETRVVQDLQMWTRRVAPTYEVRDGSSTTLDDWFGLLPTRLYNETQCKSFLSYEEDIRTERLAASPQIGVSGIIAGGNVCDLANNTWDALERLAISRRGSPNSVQMPLSTAEGVLLVSLPGVWEFVTALTLLSVRIATGKTRRVSPRQKLGWIVLEVGTIVVAAGECALLSLSVVNQLEWQPCWIGRWAGGRQTFEDRGELRVLDAEEVLIARSDVIALECVEDPGTDAKWAIIIGVVVMFHLVLLMLECVYFTVPTVRSAVDESLSTSYQNLMRHRRWRVDTPESPAGSGPTGGRANEDDDNIVPTHTPHRRVRFGSLVF